ncbi:hypothetical protein [Streptomyces sp. SID8374]|uniref:hypothetical protein n=1 Tax=Streptomyces sp. SID8374 TaxID=2690354 RepID=UPI001F2C3D6D|nr:hypothetical protein [Streptomyces sp. SID8374]
MAFQRHTLDLLSAAGPATTEVLGSEAAVGNYFTDLRVLCQLIKASWPRARDILPDPGLAEALDADQAAPREEQPFADRPQSLIDAPALASAPCAALLAAADRLLRLENSRDLGEHVRSLVVHDPRRRSSGEWRRDFLDTRPDCSQGFLQAVAPVLQTYARELRPRALKRPIRRTRFGPQHIPHFLEDDWYKRYFAHMDGIPASSIRRTAVLHLCQIAVGGSLFKAGTLLGLPLNPAGTHRASDNAKAVHNWARTRPDPQEFEFAVHALADELDSRDDLVDYRRRRDALRYWCIDPATWNEITDRIPIPTGRGGRPDFSDRKRRTASIIMWTTLTQGEHVYAAHPIRDQQPRGTHQLWRTSDSAFWARIQHGTTGTTDNNWLSLLSHYAAFLAPIIDKDGTVPPGISPWTPGIGAVR